MLHGRFFCLYGVSVNIAAFTEKGLADNTKQEESCYEKTETDIGIVALIGIGKLSFGDG
jgi:hypothetical protein